MKTKETIESKHVHLDKLNVATKPKSLRPMRSMVAVRSLKPRTVVASLVKPVTEVTKN